MPWGSSDLALVWLWCRPGATAPIRPLPWKPTYAMGVVLKRKKKKEREREREDDGDVEQDSGKIDGRM